MAERPLVIAPNWLGDAVMALPALTSLRRHWPEATLTVAARASVAPLFTMVDGVDEVVTLETSGGAGAVNRWRRDAHRLATGRHDVAILLPNSFLSAWTVHQARVPERWGYAADLRAPLLTRAVPRPRTLLHQADYYLALVRALGLPGAAPYARVRVDAATQVRVDDLLAGSGLAPADGYVAMAPGAAYGRAKQWLPERYAELAGQIARSRGDRTVLVGTRTDQAVCGWIRAEAARLTPGVPPAVDLSGRTDLPALAGVLARARAVVANDSGAMHLAGAVGARVVAVFGATNEQHTRPLTADPAQAPPAIVTHPVWCRPCMLRECPIDHRCMRGVEADRVMQAIEHLTL
jgi:heptosyltransferase-2